MGNVKQNREIGNFRLFSNNKALINYFATHILLINTKYRDIFLRKNLKMFLWVFG